MKQTKFRVEFAQGESGKGPFMEVPAFSAEQAKILAQAERIKAGLDYKVEHIWSDVYPEFET